MSTYALHQQSQCSKDITDIADSVGDDEGDHVFGRF